MPAVIYLILKFKNYHSPNKIKIQKLLSILLLGYIYIQLFCLHELQQKLYTPTDSPILITGKITGIPQQTPQYIRFEFTTKEYRYQHILLKWYKTAQTPTPTFKPGQTWQLTVKLKPPRGLANKAGFDYEKWLFRHDIDAMGTIRTANLIKISPETPIDYLHYNRYHIAQWLDKQFPEQPYKGLIKALTIGDKSDISPQSYQTLKQSGIAHLIAISGMHIGIVAALGYYLGYMFFWVFRPQTTNRRFLQSAFALLLATAYTMLAGLSTPTIRALLMLIIYLLSVIRKRSNYSWDTYGTALFIILILDPLSVLDMGFWLSFGAVFILLYAFSGRTNSSSKSINFIRAQWVILIGLVPLNILFFNQITIATPLSNWVLIPVVTFLLIPLLFLTLIIGTFHEATPNWLATPIEWSIDLVYWVANFFSQLTWLQWPVSIKNNIELLLLFISMLIILAPKVIPWRWLAIGLLLPLSLPKTNHQLEQGEAIVITFDVGQGLAVLIKTQNHVLLYDTGASYSGSYSMAENVISPFLNKDNIKKLDTLILSHADNDHSGGSQFLQKNLKIGRIIASFSPYELCHHPQSWSWDGVLFEIISPFNNNPYLGNNSSCVLHISTIHHRLLLTGDIESAIEYRLQHHLEKPLSSDILFVPHHGSNTSSTRSFLQAVNPDFAINSSGYANAFGHPSDQVVNRYKQQGIKLFDTQKDGMIELYIGKNLMMNSYRKNNKHIWNL